MHASCNYKHPLRFEEEVEIHLLVREIRMKTVEYLFVFRKMKDGRPIEVARGSMIAAAVSMEPGARTMRAVAIPPDIRAKIDAAPAELLARVSGGTAGPVPARSDPGSAARTEGVPSR